MSTPDNDVATREQPDAEEIAPLRRTTAPQPQAPPWAPDGSGEHDGAGVPHRELKRAVERSQRAPGAEAGPLPRPTSPQATRRRHSAQDITSERILRPQAEPPQQGWRRALYRLTAGRINVGPGAGELSERALIGRIKAPVQGCRRVAVVSRKGGTGKTTTTLMLGHTLATHRGDRVIALDGNPDAGSLGDRVRRESDATVMHLLTNRREIQRYADIRAYTSQSVTRLEVVAADDDPKITNALGEGDFVTAVDLLERHYNLVCMDTGTGVLESASQGILHLADQLVVVTGASLDETRTTSSTLDWLESNGYADLVDESVAVINSIGPQSQVDVDAIERHFAARCRAVVRIPWDAHLAAGGESSLTRLTPATRTAYLELTAAVADGFADPPRHRTDKSHG